jgi:hypothetical protein
MGWIRALILVCAWIGIVAAQADPLEAPALQLGTPVERSITPGTSHYYQVIAEENTLVQITVEQRGIDVVVRVHHPQSQRLGEFDSPNGADGPEDVSFVTAAKIPYRIEVTPLSREPGPAGRYEIRLIEMRAATDQEIKQSKDQEALKERGLALLGEIEGAITELRLPQSRIKAQMQVAGLLWDSDDKRALKYVTDAITGVKELMSNIDPNSREYTNTYHVINNLRYEVVQALTMRQPELALNFLRSTPPLPDPWGNQRDVASNEAGLEMQIANQLAEKDPKRTLEIARENLKKRYSSAISNTIATLRQKNPEMAAELATEVANKLLGEKLLKNPEAGALLTSLIHMSAPVVGNHGAETNGGPRRRALLSDQTRRDLVQKAANEALSYKPPSSNVHTSERGVAWNLLQGLQSIGQEVESVMAGGAAAMEKKIKEFNVSNPRMDELQKLHALLNNQSAPVDEIIRSLSKAPAEAKDQLFVHLANRLQNNGDTAHARQIVNDYVTAPHYRQSALYNLEIQEAYRAIGRGKADEALRAIANLSSAQERAQALAQMANQIGPGYKRATAMLFLDQARALLSPSVQAQDQAQMQALLEIAKAFSRYDSKRGFEIVDPLVDQFNELSTAARTLEGFGGQFYEQEELNLHNNVIGNVATQITSTLAVLGSTNFDRAKLTADRFRLPEVRIRAYLDIAQQAIQNPR